MKREVSSKGRGEWSVTTRRTREAGAEDAYTPDRAHPYGRRCGHTVWFGTGSPSKPATAYRRAVAKRGGQNWTVVRTGGLRCTAAPSSLRFISLYHPLRPAADLSAEAIVSSILTSPRIQSDWKAVARRTLPVAKGRHSRTSCTRNMKALLVGCVPLPPESDPV